jgi:hypothetical protein
VTDRERGIQKARKVFALGVATPYRGEKESCLQRLWSLLQLHTLLLSDLDAKFPRRQDQAFLRLKFGLLSAEAGQTPSSGQSASAGPRPQKPGKGKNKKAPGQNTASENMPSEELLFRAMVAAERKRWLHGPRFSQGLLQIVRNTTAYPRLLKEVRALNRSNLGLGWTERDLLEWLDKVLSRQGSRVECLARSQTIFEDLLAYCRLSYTADTAQERKAQEQEEARQQAEEAQRAAAAQEDEEGDWFEFEMAFDELAEARLYMKVVRRLAGEVSEISSYSRHKQFFVKFTGTDDLDANVAQTYAQALYDLQRAADRIRLQAGHARDEAIRRVETDYETACAQAFQVAVDHYRA